MEKLSRNELIVYCKEHNIKRYSGKKKYEILNIIKSNTIYKIVSLFSGMGGMDIGFAENITVHKNSIDSGMKFQMIDSQNIKSNIDGFVNLKRLPFKIVFQNDILPEAKEIAELNNWTNNYILKDINELLKDNYKFPEADVIIGGFPCTTFSHAGKREGLNSTKGTLYQSYIEVVKRVKPILFVAENVNGLLTMPSNPIKKIVDDFSSVGYEVKYQLIKCEEYGIPQTRWRVIIMGIRIDKHALLKSNWNIIEENKVKCYIKHYFKHLQEPNLSEDLAQQVYSKAKRLTKGQGQKEITLEGFAPTMRAEHHGNIEFRRIKNGINKENLDERRLTVREAALIQTFPPNCILMNPNKKTSKAYKPIGNAVPPLLGYIIARKVQQILDIVS